MTKISDKTINRLTQYHCILTDCAIKNIDNITSSFIADLVKVDDSQVRKDISSLKVSGKSRAGYDVVKLKSAIEKTLGFQKPKNIFIIGAGNLGSALAKYDSFQDYGLNILAMFDVDPKKIGTTINGKKVYELSDVKCLAKQMNVEIAILTVPSKFAQKTADYLAGTGIKYIWNFAPVVLKTNENIEVWNENLMGNFLRFSYKI